MTAGEEKGKRRRGGKGNADKESDGEKGSSSTDNETRGTRRATATRAEQGIENEEKQAENERGTRGRDQNPGIREEVRDLSERDDPSTQ